MKSPLAAKSSHSVDEHALPAAGIGPWLAIILPSATMSPSSSDSLQMTTGCYLVLGEVVNPPRYSGSYICLLG